MFNKSLTFHHPRKSEFPTVAGNSDLGNVNLIHFLAQMNDEVRNKVFVIIRRFFLFYYGVRCGRT